VKEGKAKGVGENKNRIQEGQPGGGDRGKFFAGRGGM